MPAVPFVTKNSPSRSSPETIRHKMAPRKCRVWLNWWWTCCSKQSAKLQRAHRHVHSGIHGQNDIREPIHQVQQRVPVEIWVVPSELAGELLEHAQEAGNH